MKTASTVSATRGPNTRYLTFSVNTVCLLWFSPTYQTIIGAIGDFLKIFEKIADWGFQPGFAPDRCTVPSFEKSEKNGSNAKYRQFLATFAIFD